MEFCFHFWMGALHLSDTYATLPDRVLRVTHANGTYDTQPAVDIITTSKANIITSTTPIKN